MPPLSECPMTLTPEAHRPYCGPPVLGVPNVPSDVLRRYPSKDPPDKVKLFCCPANKVALEADTEKEEGDVWAPW